MASVTSVGSFFISSQLATLPWRFRAYHPTWQSNMCQASSYEASAITCRGGCIVRALSPPAVAIWQYIVDWYPHRAKP